MRAIDNIVVVILNLIFFLLPINASLTPPFIIALIVLWLYDWKNIFSLQKLWSNKYLLVCLAYFFIYAVSSVYSDFNRLALFNLQVKLSFLAFPLVFGMSNFANAIIQDRYTLFRSFIMGGLFSIGMNLLSSSYKFFVSNEPANFIYREFSFIAHPSYYAMYLCLGVLFLLGSLSGKIVLYKRNVLVSSLCLVAFSIAIVLAGSKAGIISILAILISFLAYIMFIDKNWKLSVVFISIISFLILFNMFNPVLKKRTEEMANATTTKEMSTSAVRLVIWKSSIKKILEKPLFGYGNGDVSKVLYSEYVIRDVEKAAKRQYNCHNQYLQTLMATGVIGGVVFFLMFFIPLWECLKNRDWIYLAFILLVAFNILVESMFERQAGVIFYALFNSMFYFRKKLT